MKHTIYGLCDPRDFEVRYVGYTSKTVESRLTEHIEETKSRSTSYKHKWIKKLLRENVKPGFVILEEVTEQNWQERERFWIQHYGVRLVNSTAGGEGLVNPSTDVRSRIGATVKASCVHIGNQHRRGIPHTDASKQAIRDGLARSEKYQAAMANRKGVAPMHATLAAAKVNKGATLSEERRQKLRVPKKDNSAWIGKRHSDATKEKIRLGNLGNKNGLGNKLSSEVRAKIAAGRVGRKYANDGLVSILLELDQPLPDGWVFGRLQKLRT